MCCCVPLGRMEGSVCACLCVNQAEHVEGFDDLQSACVYISETETEQCVFQNRRDWLLLLLQLYH